MSTRTRIFCAASLILALSAGAGVTQQPASPGQDGARKEGSPLSAIDWLSRSVESPRVALEPPVSGDASVGSIDVRPLPRTPPDALGLLPASDYGLSADLWGPTPTERIVSLINAQAIGALPAARGLVKSILLAQLDPPVDSNGGNLLLLERIDKLLSFAALGDAAALLNHIGTGDAALFRRWFDISLLTGQEDHACQVMRDTPQIAPTLPARIFCLARGGDWNAAALTLETAQALDAVSREEDALLRRFLDPEYDDPNAGPLVTDTVTPLQYKMLAAIGEPLPSRGQPLAFAHADLTDQSGWKSQIEAAERLARRGAVDPSRLAQIYMMRLPAASGGLWDRVGAQQALESALQDRDPQAIARTLPVAWTAMSQARLSLPFSRYVAPQLEGMTLPDALAPLVFRIRLLTDEAERAAREHTPATPAEALLKAVAMGEMSGAKGANDVEGAVISGLSGEIAPDKQLPPDLSRMLREKRVGEAILTATALLNTGAASDPGDIAAALALLRSVGLDHVARRAGLQLILTEAG